MKESLYLAAGEPKRCQNEACRKPFDGYCFRGDNERYYCSEICAQVGMEIDFNSIANSNGPRIDKLARIVAAAVIFPLLAQSGPAGATR